MASYMDSSMSSLIAPSQTVEKQLSTGSDAFFKGADQGMKTAIGLATADDEVKQKKAQTEKMQDELDSMRYNKMLNLMNSTARASLNNPKVGATVAKQSKASADRLGLNMDPAIFDDLQSNEEARRKLLGAMPTLMNLSADPAARIQAFQTVQSAIDPTGNAWSDHLDAFMKGNQQAELEKMRNEANIKAAGIRADAQKTSGVGVAREDSLIERVNRGFDADPLIRPYVKAQDAIGRGFHTLNNPPGGIVSVQLIKEISNDIAQSLAMGAQSSADDREKQEYKGIETKWAAVASYINSAPENVDAPKLVEYLKQNLKRIDESYKQNISQRVADLAKGRAFKSAGANDAVKEKVKAYSNRSGIANTGDDVAEKYKRFHDAVQLQHPDYPEAKIQAFWQKQQGGK